jgi:bifunctional DNA-binding transcriptional regulator/antitoxin component of YhaV-PrlF toxin-antitoxin module
MGYPVRIQKVDRGNTKSYYVNFPAAVAESSNLKKGEEMEWGIEDRNTFVLKRVKPAKNNIEEMTQRLGEFYRQDLQHFLKLTRMPYGTYLANS